jgi:hypothetical protein
VPFFSISGSEFVEMDGFESNKGGYHHVRHVREGSIGISCWTVPISTEERQF